jgi:hypothetical protein
MKKIFAALVLICLPIALVWAQKTKTKRPAKPKTATAQPAPPPAVAPQATPKPAMPQNPRPTFSVFAGDNPKDLPSAEEILARYYKADGTEAVKDKIKTRVMTGSFEVMGAGLSGSVAVYQKAPNLLFSDVELPQMGRLSQGYDGQFGWAKDNINGLRNLNGSELSQIRIGAYLNPKDTQKLYGEFKVKGVERVGERDAYVIIATVIGSSPVTHFFDKETGLLLRTDYEQEGPQGTKLPLQVFFDDYRDIDGIKLAFFSRTVNPGFTIEMRFYQAKHNLEVDDKKFQRPSQ